MKLYTYDHCPYCVRTRLALGLKDIPFDHIVLLNDDEATPIGFIGAKKVPILQKENGTHMGESMEIVRYIDSSDGDPSFAELNADDAFQDWYQATSELIRKLLFPRWVRSPLPEFATESARAYFTRKKTETIGDFDEALANTPKLKTDMEQALGKLEPLIQSPHASRGVLSYEDIDLFGKLRGLTLIKDLRIPTRVRAYIDTMAQAGKVPLYDELAEL